MNTGRALLPGLAVVAAFMLAGCGGLVRDAPAPAIYRLFAPGLAPGAPLAAQLRVDRPVAAAGLGGDRIATLWPGGRIDYYRGALWGDELPRVVEGALVEALARNGRMQVVQGDRAPFAPTHVLHVDIRRFEADYSAGSPPVVRIALGATVGLAADRRALAAFEAAAEARAAADTQTAVMSAFNDAFGRATVDLCARLQDAIQRPPGPPRPAE
ncbi:MAG: ABC-type transport auxiliary lipoprotein family protein [Steroidobacteraceae bacterium]